MKRKLFLAALFVASALGMRAQASFNATYTEGVTVDAGSEYFLYNIGSKQFLTDGMDWGTHATTDNAGRLITLATLPNGTYSIYTESYSVNNGEQALAGFMTLNGYLDTPNNDANWQFTPIEFEGYTNAYTIKHSDTQYLMYNAADTRVNVGESTNDAYSYWLLIPKNVREAHKDYTYLLQNTNFNHPWERVIWAGGGTHGGAASNPNREVYRATFDIYQTVSKPVLDGKYVLYSQGFCRKDNNSTMPAYLYINNGNSRTPLCGFNANGENTAATMVGASAAFDAGQYVNSVTSVVTNQTLRVGVRNDNANNWVLFDNFYLEYLGRTLINDAIALPSDGKMDADQWYFVDFFVADNNCTITATDIDKIVYTTNGEELTNDANLNVTTTFANGNNSVIAARYYVKSSVSNSLTIESSVEVPESTVPETYYINEGAKRTIYTLDTENLIKNGTFSYGNPLYGWTTVDYTNYASTENFTIEQEGGAVDGGAYIITNGAGVGSENTLRKSVAVEVGQKYYFSVYTSGKAPDANNFKYNALFKMTDATTEEDPGVIKEFEWPQGAAQTTTTWSKTECVFTAETPYVGVRMGWNQNSKFDEFVLVKIIDEKEVGNVDYAKAAIPTMNIGYDVFQYPQAVADQINNEFVQDETTVAEVENAVKALQVLNQPKEGQLYNIINVSDGYDFKNNALTFKSAADADLTKNTTAMSWGEQPGSIYPQAVEFTKVEGTQNGYTLNYTRADGKKIYVSTGIMSGLDTQHAQIRPTQDPSKALTVVVQVANGTQWKLLNTANNNNPIGASGANNNGFYTSNNNFAFVKFQEAAKTNYALAVAAENQYGTLIVPFDTEIPEDLTVYAVNTTEGSLLTLETVDEIKANVPYIVFAESGIETTTLSGLGNAYTDTEYTEGLLTGLYAAKEITEGYVLQNQGGVVAFYQVNAEKPVKVTANRAYLKATDGIDVKGAYFFDDEATGIQNVLNAFTSGNVEVFNASGVRQNGLQKGLNIIRMEDGSVRKVMVK